jgi:hypothetical protein
MRLFKHGPVLALMLLAAAGTALLAVTSAPQKQEFRGRLVSGDFDPLHTISSIVTFVIDRQTTETEKSELVAAFNSGGPQAFLDVLRKLPKVGYFRLPDSIAYDIHCVLQHTTPEGGRTLFMATDRPVGFGERYNQSRSLNYPFTAIELRLDKNGRGEGTIAPEARIIVSEDGQYFDVENYGPLPIIVNPLREVK